MLLNSPSKLLIRRQLTEYGNKVLRSAAAIWIPNDQVVIPRNNNVLAIVRGPRGVRLYGAINIVTNTGDIYYAETGSEATPTNAFNRLFLSGVAFSPSPVKGTDAGDLASTIAGAESAEESTYPKANDADADNTGKGVDVITHKFAYSAASFNDASIEGLTITVTGTTFGSGTNPLLNAADFSPTVNKSATDTLTVYINHTINGV